MIFIGFESVLLGYQYSKERGFFKIEIQMINFSIKKHNRRTIKKELIREKWEFEKHKQSHHLIFPAKSSVL